MSRGVTAERWRQVAQQAGELSDAEYVRACARVGIGSKSALIEHAAITRGLETSRWSSTEILVELPGASGAPIVFHEMNGPRSMGGRFYCDEKTVARDVLRRAGLQVAISQEFEPGEIRQGLDYAQRIGYPVVVKPANLARGMGVSANIQNPLEFESAWRRARTAHQGWLHVAAALARSAIGASQLRRARNLPASAAAYREIIREAGATAWQRRWLPVLVEKHFHGNDFRAFVVGDEVVSVTARQPANIVGDGVATVHELIDRKNAIRARNAYLCDHPIPTTPALLDRLAGAGLTLSHVPAPGDTVVLRSASNLSAGGDSIDLTEEAHPGFIDIAIRAVGSIPGLEYGGVDLITPDITAPPTATNYIVGEVEHSPATLAHFPLIGTSRDMAAAVLQYYLDRGARGTDGHDFQAGKFGTVPPNALMPHRPLGG